METNRNLTQGRFSTNPLNDVESWNTYLYVYSFNLVHRYPSELIDSQSIDTDRIRRIAEFSMTSANIALDVVSSSQESRQVRQQRVA